MKIRVIHTEVVANHGRDGDEFLDTAHALDGSFIVDEKIVVISKSDYQRLLYLVEETNVSVPLTWKIADWWKAHGPDPYIELPLVLIILVIVGAYIYTVF
jgi:hypothetical protein